MGLVARNKTALLGGAAIMVALAGTCGARAQQAQEPQGTPVLMPAGQPLAQAPVDASSVTMLDRLTFITRTEQAPIDTLASVNLVGGEALERRMATTAQGIFFGVPGIAIQTDSKRSLSTVNIRGLQDFGRVAVIVDGARQNFQRSGHGTQSVFWIDPDLVQQVEVIRGPVANTYGSGAIGGVVNFETKDAADFLRDGETWAVSTTARYETNGEGWTTSTTGAYSFSDAFDVLGNIVYRDYNNYTDGGNEVFGTGFDALSGMLKSTIRPTENSELKLGWIGAEDNWNEGVDTYASTLKQNTLTARYNVTDEDNSWLDLHINGGVNLANLDQTYLKDVVQFNSETGLPVTVLAGSKATYDLNTYGLDIWNTSRFETAALTHELTYGGDWLADDVATTAADGGANVYTPSGNRTLWGLHVQDKVSYEEWLEVIGGLRYDNYSLDGDGTEASGSRVSPRITVGVSPFTNDALKGLQVYGTYAEGYRSPSVTETLMSGLHPNGVVFPFLPNPNLRPETGKTWELGVNYKRDGILYADDSLRLKAAYFNNDVSDYIGGTEINASPLPGNICPFRTDLPPVWMGGSYVPTCFQYQNFANAKINGVELEAAYDAGHFFAGLSASVTNGYTVSYVGIREDLLTIPSSQVTASLGFRMLENKALTIGGEVQYNGAPKGAAYAEDYTLVNAYANYQVSDNFRLDFRADNIFDVKYANPLNATTTSIVYEPGLTLKFGATIRLGG